MKQSVKFTNGYSSAPVNHSVMRHAFHSTVSDEGGLPMCVVSSVSSTATCVSPVSAQFLLCPF